VGSREQQPRGALHVSQLSHAFASSIDRGPNPVHLPVLDPFPSSSSPVSAGACGLSLERAGVAVAAVTGAGNLGCVRDPGLGCL
jgi:hypothetical protein